MCLSGLLMLPFAYTSVLIEPTYWLPVRLAVFLTGPEDFIIAFACGGTSLLISIWFLQDRLIFTLDPARMARRYIIGTFSGLTIGGLFRLLGIGPLAAMVMAFVCFGLVVFWLGRRLWQVALAGLIGFTCLYFGVVKTMFILYPDFIQQWNTPNLWGPQIFGVPLDELTGAAGYAAAWPLFIAYVFDARLRQSKDMKTIDSC